MGYVVCMASITEARLLVLRYSKYWDLTQMFRSEILLFRFSTLKKYWILAILDIKSKFQKSCWAGWIPPQGFPSPLFRLFERAHIWQISAICCCKTHSNLKLLKFRCIVLQLTWKSSIEPIWNTWPNLYLWKPTNTWFLLCYWKNWANTLTINYCCVTKKTD